MNPHSIRALPAVLPIFFLGAASAFADGGDLPGAPGTAEAVGRTVEVLMTDNAFEPQGIAVTPGETIRFEVKNTGEFVHEFNIGNAKTHAHHQEEMLSMMMDGIIEVDRINHDKMAAGGMMHSDPNSVLLAPGEQAEIIWRFGTDGDLEFACNVPGHYESGMVGRIELL